MEEGESVKRHHTSERIDRILSGNKKMLNAREDVVEVRQQLESIESSRLRRRSQYGVMKVSNVESLKEGERKLPD